MIGDEQFSALFESVKSPITKIENTTQERLIRESEAKIVEIIKDLTAKLQ